MLYEKHIAKSQGRLMERVAIHVTGIPATFATAGERPWKDALANQIPQATVQAGLCGIVLRFQLRTLTPNGMPLDVDNLCEPVFSVLVNRQRWFGGRRPNIAWWHARKSHDATTGCDILLTDEGLATLPNTPPDVSGIYDGPLPRSAKSIELADWSKMLPGRERIETGRSPLAVRISFGTARINLGDIATGVLKSVIDCMYPIWGGLPGRPNDHRISQIWVEKAVGGLTATQIAVQVWNAFE